MGRPLTILHVDDDTIDLRLVRKAIAKTSPGTNVVFAETGADGLHTLIDRTRNIGPSDLLVLLDIQLPDTSGIDLLARIRETPDMKGIPVVMLSTSDAPNDRNASYERGASAYFVKPAGFPDWVELADTIVEYWRRARPWQP